MSCVPPLHVHLEPQTVTLFRSEVLQMCRGKDGIRV